MRAHEESGPLLLPPPGLHQPPPVLHDSVCVQWGRETRLATHVTLVVLSCSCSLKSTVPFPLPSTTCRLYSSCSKMRSQMMMLNVLYLCTPRTDTYTSCGRQQSKVRTYHADRPHAHITPSLKTYRIPLSHTLHYHTVTLSHHHIVTPSHLSHYHTVTLSTPHLLRKEVETERA